MVGSNWLGNYRLLKTVDLDITHLHFPRYLRKYSYKVNSKKTLSTQQRVDMAIQVLLGLMYLNGQRYLHNDVATRNCV